jgi:hypothetical protein
VVRPDGNIEALRPQVEERDPIFGSGVRRRLDNELLVSVFGQRNPEQRQAIEFHRGNVLTGLRAMDFQHPRFTAHGIGSRSTNLFCARFRRAERRASTAFALRFKAAAMETDERPDACSFSNRSSSSGVQGFFNFFANSEASKLFAAISRGGSPMGRAKDRRDQNKLIKSTDNSFLFRKRPKWDNFRRETNSVSAGFLLCWECLMDQRKDDPQELARKMEQARRIVSGVVDDTTYRRLVAWIGELKRALQERKLRNKVRARARKIWEQNGRPSDRDVELWLQAEAGIDRKYPIEAP